MRVLQSEKFAIMKEEGKAWLERYEKERIAALPFPNPINRHQRRANIAQERK
jgi:hypothetical protein